LHTPVVPAGAWAWLPAAIINPMPNANAVSVLIAFLLLPVGIDGPSVDLISSGKKARQFRVARANPIRLFLEPPLL
jgi:hypothetical protein